MKHPVKVLVVGGGAREHSICHAISKSDLAGEIYCFPGNAGIDKIATPVQVKSNNITEVIKELLEFSKDNEIDFVVVGPEIPLVAGIVDRFEQAGIKVFGPSQKASILEGSKVFMKDLCSKYEIPTASYRVFTDGMEARTYMHQNKFPIVIKADGLAAGKGVTIAKTVVEAEKAFDDVFRLNKFNSDQIVIEEFLDGEELSFFVLTDGKTVLPLASAQDHKKAYDGDKGPNTGGMGAYSPAPMMTNELETEILETIIVPTLEAMKCEGREYKGVLYAGVILTNEGPKLLEYNIRFGDPECQVLIPRLNVDLLDLLLACVEERLNEVNVSWNDNVSLTVVMANNGYPGSHETGSVIRNLNKAEALEGVNIFHAGTQIKNRRTIAVGGRVLSVVATGRTAQAAQKKVYDAINIIDWPEGQYRTDIGWRSLNR